MITKGRNFGVASIAFRFAFPMRAAVNFELAAICPISVATPPNRTLLADGDEQSAANMPLSIFSTSQVFRAIFAAARISKAAFCSSIRPLILTACRTWSTVTEKGQKFISSSNPSRVLSPVFPEPVSLDTSCSVMVSPFSFLRSSLRTMTPAPVSLSIFSGSSLVMKLFQKRASWASPQTCFPQSFFTREASITVTDI